MVGLLAAIGHRLRVAVRAAAEWASTHDDLVTLGVKPTRPETGYGYLRTGETMGPSGGGALRVSAFVEKPAITAFVYGDLCVILLAVETGARLIEMNPERNDRNRSRDEQKAKDI